VPVLNGSRTLRECLLSILNQTIEPLEVIVVDNNSTDTTAAIVKELQREHPKVVYVFEEKKTRGAARNAGIKVAKGEIIAMTDVDCIVPSDWLEKLTYPLVSGREAVVVGSQYDLVNTYWSRNMQKMHDYIATQQKRLDGYIPFIDTKNFAIHSLLLKSTLFDPSFKAVEDEDFSLRLRPIAFFRYLPEVKVGHRHAQSLMNTMRTSFSRSYWSMQLYHKYKNAIDMNGNLVMFAIPRAQFFKSLLYFDKPALKKQGSSHILFFIVYDLTWKLGRLYGYFRQDPEVVSLGRR
jgi:glycosyltransferase involved in cell wall biosynthesis